MGTARPQPLAAPHRLQLQTGDVRQAHHSPSRPPPGPVRSGHRIGRAVGRSRHDWSGIRQGRTPQPESACEITGTPSDTCPPDRSRPKPTRTADCRRASLARHWSGRRATHHRARLGAPTRPLGARPSGGGSPRGRGLDGTGRRPWTRALRRQGGGQRRPVDRSLGVRSPATTHHVRTGPPDHPQG